MHEMQMGQQHVGKFFKKRKKREVSERESERESSAIFCEKIF
jgi:hypothetical protein